MRTASVILTIVAAAVVVGGAVATAPPCDPLDPALCVFPYPNDYWLVKGADGVPRTSFGNSTWPKDDLGKIFDASNGWDGVPGFSPGQACVTFLPNMTLDASPDVPRLWNMALSLQDTAATALINTETGERVAHWVEADHSSDAWDASTPRDDLRALTAWPSRRLNGSTRYVFAVGPVASLAGGSVVPSDAFRALRDDTPSPRIDPARRAHFESDVFPFAAAAGLQRSTLTIAWDFTTASDGEWTRDMLAMRSKGFAAAGAGPQYEVLSHKPSPRAGIALEINGNMTVPWFLSTLGPEIGTSITRDAAGAPLALRNASVGFKALVPESVANGSLPASAVYYGHGLFGSRAELDDQYLDSEANANGWILIGVDWIGLSQVDLASDAFMVATDLSLFRFIVNRLHQAQLNALLALRMLWTSLAADPLLARQGVPLLGPSSPRLYYGNSLGGILGSVNVALSQDVHRAVLGVPGGPFGILLPRSKDFAALFDIIRLRYSGTLDRVAMMSAIQQQFTYLEPAGYAQAVWEQPFPDTPRHSVLVHYGQGDAQVNWVSAEWLGRSIGGLRAYDGTMLVRNCSLFGFEMTPNDSKLRAEDGGLMQGFYFGVPDANIPLENVPCASATDTHTKTRRTAHAMEQNAAFLGEGVIFNPCGGQCHEHE